MGNSGTSLRLQLFEFKNPDYLFVAMVFHESGKFVFVVPKLKGPDVPNLVQLSYVSWNCPTIEV